MQEYIASKGDELKSFENLFPKVYFKGEATVNDDTMPRFRLFDETNRHFYYLVMDLNGGTVAEACSRREHSKVQFALQMGIQLVNLVEVMHGAGVIHNDISKDNLVCGQHIQNPDQVQRLRMIDFGCGTSYLKPNGEHYKKKKDGEVS